MLPGPLRRGSVPLLQRPGSGAAIGGGLALLPCARLTEEFRRTGRGEPGLDPRVG